MLSEAERKTVDLARALEQRDAEVEKLQAELLKITCERDGLMLHLTSSQEQNARLRAEIFTLTHPTN